MEVKHAHEMGEAAYIELLDRFAIAALPLCANSSVAENDGRRLHRNSDAILAGSIAYFAYQVAEEMMYMRELSIEDFRSDLKTSLEACNDT